MSEYQFNPFKILDLISLVQFCIFESFFLFIYLLLFIKTKTLKFREFN